MVPHCSVLCATCIELLWVPAEDRPVGLILSDCCALGYVELQGGKNNLFLLENSCRRDNLLSMLWNKEMSSLMVELEAWGTTEVGQGEIMYLSFKMADCKLNLSRQPQMTVEFTATYEKIAQLLYRADLKEIHQLA